MPCGAGRPRAVPRLHLDQPLPRVSTLTCQVPVCKLTELLALPGTAGVNTRVGTPNVGVNVQTRIADNRPDAWRYRWENNCWWYWAPDNRWMWYSDPGGWTYVAPNGGYSAGYGGVAVTPAVPAVPVAPNADVIVPPTTTYYYYPSSGYYYRGYPRYYYGRPGYYYGGRGRGR